MTTMSIQPHSLFFLSNLLLALFLLAASSCHAWDGWSFPQNITLRAGVLHAPPFAILEEQLDGSIKYSGFQIDLVERLKIFAAQDNITLNIELAPSPPNFNPALDLVANDCNTTRNPNSLEDCQKFDLIIANYYATPARCTRVALSPPWLRSTITTLKYLDKPEGATDYTTLKQAEDAHAPICVKGGTFFATVVKAKFPKGNFVDCPTLEECIATLKRGECVLSAEDELMSRYSQAWDVSLEVTREQFNTQYKVWPYSYALPFETRLLMEKWLRDANTNATLDELYSKYFQKSLCPVGTAGENCDKPCDPIHGTSNNRGVCVCSSTKWTGDDCSIEVEEELNLIPQYMIFIAYSMLGCNVFVILACAIWLFWQRNSIQVRVSQPFFLALVLVGCMISSSTIIVLSQEDEGDGPVHACMAIPWLYSVGFSVTFGTLFAKILRVYAIFKKAAANQVAGGSRSSANNRNNIISVQGTLGIIGSVLLVDCVLLICWTLLDPLQWERTVISADQFGAPLESEGRCVSDYWLAYAGALAGLHLLLLGTACYLCYVSRDIPTRFSEGKYVSIAMISNLQIFLVGVPILIIIGTEPATSFFVRCTIIWMNDLAVVVLLFGNLIYSVHFKAEVAQEDVKKAVERFGRKQQSQYKSTTSQNNHNYTTSRFSTTGGSQEFSMERTPVGSASRLVTWHEDGSSKPIDEDDDDHCSGGGRSSLTRKTSKSSTHSSGSRSKKPVDVLRNNKDSWACVNPSRYEAAGAGGTADNDSNSTFEDEEQTPPPPEQAVRHPLRSLKGKGRDRSANKNSWAAVTLSHFSSAVVEEEEEEAEESEHEQEQERSEETKPQQRPSYELPPAKLPKNGPSHMSYAQDRISKIRGQHAQYLAEKKGTGKQLNEFTA